MVVDSRDRVTVDLRGLGPAVKAQAAARGLTLAAFARAAIVEALPRDPFEPSAVRPDDGQPVKLLGTETAVLRLEDGTWRIVHIHWSSRKPKA